MEFYKVSPKKLYNSLTLTLYLPGILLIIRSVTSIERGGRIMRIAIFTDTYAPEINGVARTLNRLTGYLKENQVDFQVFAPESSTQVPTVAQVQRFTSLPFLLYRECRLAIPNPAQIKLTLEKFNPTFIHIATPFNLGLYGLHYAKKHGIPIVASYHTHFDDYLHYYNLQFLEKWIWRYMTWFHRPCEKVYVPSLETKEKLLKHSIHDNIDIWGRGVDHTFFSPVKRTTAIREKYRIREKHILLYVGRISPEKEINLALETFHSLPKQVKNNTHFLVVGDGPLLKTLSESTSDNVTFTGFIEGEELANIYASSDIFLFPSATETFGNVVLEAMASGLPVVGARAGGVQQLITHEQNGYLCEPGKTESFKAAVQSLIESRLLRAEMASKAQKFAKDQSWDDIFSRLLSSYTQISKEKKKLITA